MTRYTVNADPRFADRDPRDSERAVFAPGDVVEPFRPGEGPDGDGDLFARSLGEPSLVGYIDAALLTPA